MAAIVQLLRPSLDESGGLRLGLTGRSGRRLFGMTSVSATHRVKDEIIHLLRFSKALSEWWILDIIGL